MTEQTGKRVAVSEHSSSPQSSIYKHPLTEIGYLARESHHTCPGEIQQTEPIAEAASPSPQSNANMGRSLGQILVVLVVLLALVNIPISYYGAGLAQIIPDTRSTVIYDGMLLKGSGPEIYVLEDYKLRWISSQEALNFFFARNTWQVVEDNLIEQFGKGQPIRRLVKCQKRPYVYALEHDQKRRIKELPPQNGVKPWDQVHLVSCDYLSKLPDGLPVLAEADPLP